MYGCNRDRRRSVVLTMLLCVVSGTEVVGTVRFGGRCILVVSSRHTPTRTQTRVNKPDKVTNEHEHEHEERDVVSEAETNTDARAGKNVPDTAPTKVHLVQ